MRTIDTQSIQTAVENLAHSVNVSLPPDVEAALHSAAARERSPLGRDVLTQILENAVVADSQGLALCQDTGMVVVFLDIGQNVRLVGPAVADAVQEGVRRGYAKGMFRASVVADPLLRENTNDNTPAVIHYAMVPGDTVRIRLAPKGFGSENMSRVAMLTPGQGRAGVVNFVVQTVSEAGGNPCPPIMVGVGLGGTMEKAALLAKEALLEPVGRINSQPHLQELEAELLETINGLGIGPQGFGGTVTAFAVHVRSYPTHIAGLPTAVNINCHAARHGEVTL